MHSSASKGLLNIDLSPTFNIMLTKMLKPCGKFLRQCYLQVLWQIAFLDGLHYKCRWQSAYIIHICVFILILGRKKTHRKQFIFRFSTVQWCFALQKIILYHLNCLFWIKTDSTSPAMLCSTNLPCLRSPSSHTDSETNLDDASSNFFSACLIVLLKHCT